MGYGKNTHKGKFVPKNPQKYKGDVSLIQYRSGWEFRVMRWLDSHPDILEWSSEEIVIPYISPMDGKKHRYFPDFYIKKRNKDGTITKALIEVKPKAQTVAPKAVKPTKGKLPQRYLNEVHTWGVNSAKWEYARMFCKQQGWDFIIMTEDEIGIKK